MYSQINPQLIRNLETLGLTENEAKAYAGLVSLGEATAREVHELTNVPRAKIYESFKYLQKKVFWKYDRVRRHISVQLTPSR